MKLELDKKLTCMGCGEKIEYYKCMLAEPAFCKKCGEIVVQQLNH